MRVVQWVFLACLSLWVGHGLLQAVESLRHHRTWIVSLPGESEMTPELRVRIQESLRKRDSSLASVEIVACLDQRILTVARIGEAMGGLVALPGFSSTDEALSSIGIDHVAGHPKWRPNPA
jgi:hypothetical protein